MEKLFTTLITISILGKVLKIGLFYLNLKVRSSKAFIAQEVINCGGMNPMIYNQMVKDVIIDQTRDKEIEEQYELFRDEFKTKLQNKELSRGKILGIKDYLYKNVKGYPKKNFNNDAHMICSLLKATDLTKKHISTIKQFID
ncbi:hypothetical protein [Clostridium gasigenes]|uniref:hypothetical protein n=1 Tax=Clostridium gasigenes TaxID=94869 RepID=UPI001C0BF556|nr:hypothetical protein [Clostridium gasigenes]MBU3106714.1 hypothetical protein [Clostridium gasigenes]